MRRRHQTGYLVTDSCFFFMKVENGINTRRISVALVCTSENLRVFNRTPTQITSLQVSNGSVHTQITQTAQS